MTAKVVLDSVSRKGDRLTTMEVTFHRFVLAEFNTHRVFSRNSASSRAIPVKRQLEKLFSDPATPVLWPAEQSGMQGGSELEGQDYLEAVDLWETAQEFTLGLVEAYVDRHPNLETRLHKSVLNRLLEPFMWHTVIVSSTEWENFFEQRCSPLAQPEIRKVADEMREVYANSTPELLNLGGWHTPYIQSDEYETLSKSERRMVSAARCARVSYLTHEGVKDLDADKELYNRLVTAVPAHWSPLEHVATPQIVPNLVGNFAGWSQLRHFV